MKRLAVLLFLILSVITCFAQTQIDPTYQIQWNALAYPGAPAANGITCTQNGNYTVYPYGAEWGQSYQDTTNNVEYKCTTSGWVKNLPTTGGTLTGALNGTSASFSGNVASTSAALGNLNITGNTTLTAFGTSISAGYGLPNPSTQAWPAQFAALRGWTINNQAISGSSCIDESQAVIQQAPTSLSNYSWDEGFNDARLDGTSSVKQAEFHSCEQGSLSWLAIPDAWKMKSTTGITSGSWSTFSLYGGTWEISSANGATLTMSLPSVGNYVELWWLGQIGSRNTFTVTIEGEVQPCNSVTNSCLNGTTFLSAITQQSGLLGQYGLQGARFPISTYQGHIVVVTLVSGDVNYPILIFGAATYDTGMGSQTGPKVYVANLERMNTAGYANNSCATTCNLSSDLVESQFDTRIHAIVSDLSGDGLQVQLVDVGSYNVYNPKTQAQGDNIHPNLAGATSIANYFYNESTYTQQVRDRGQSQALENVTAYNKSLYVGGAPSSNSSGEVGSSTSATSGILRLGLDGGYFARSGNLYGIPAAGKYVVNGVQIATGDLSDNLNIAYLNAANNFAQTQTATNFLTLAGTVDYFVGSRGGSGGSPTSLGSGAYLGWNHSNGQGEADLFTTYSSPTLTNDAFRFHAVNSSVEAIVGAIRRDGSWTVYGHVNQSATKNYAGTCAMSASTSCTFSINAVYTGTPICISGVQGATLTGGISGCALSGTTVTITAATINSLTWGAVLTGNPN